jgi:hypothetical protein
MKQGEFTKENITSDEAIERIRNLQGGFFEMPLKGSQTTDRGVRASFWKSPDNAKMRVYITERRGRRDKEIAVIDLVTGEAIRGELGYAVEALNLIPRWDE